MTGLKSDVVVARETVADLQEVIDVLTAFTGGILFELDRDGHYLRIWTGGPHLLARPAEELIGRTVEEVLGAQDGTRFHDAFRDVIDTGRPTAFEYTIDVQAGRRTFSCEIRPHDSRDGAARTVTLLVRDVTSAKAVEGKLVQAERLAALGLLAASVGHEIRQPLSYVITSAGVLERELENANLSVDARASLERIRVGAHRISEIATSLDVLAGQRRRKTDTVDIRSALQAALDLCSSALPGVHVERNVADVGVVRGDAGELCQVFANLLLNAGHACAARRARSDGEEPRITITAAREGAQVRISIADNGAGIPADHLSRVFDPFFTTKEEDGGTGLGLYITRSIVEAHAGDISVASVPELGTTVTVLLPYAAALASATPAGPPALVQEPTTGVRPALAPKRRLSVMVIDDEPRFLESLRLALEEAHDVDTAHQATDALSRLEQEPQRYDVVICDLAMPNIDGASFYERMSALGIAERFVLMTGGAFTPRAIEFMNRAACPTINKPFMLERLLALIDDVTQGRSAS